MRKPKSDYAIQTVVNALRLLEAFEGEEELGVSELSRRLMLHKNNVFRLLATLEQHGYVRQTTNERYRLDVRCLALGRAYARSQSLLRSARPLMEVLSAELGEAAHVAVLRDFQAVHLDGEPSPRLVGAAARVGQSLPAHCTALGKALLAFSTPALQEEYDVHVARGSGLAARAAGTIVDSAKLFEHLREVVNDGFALDLEECEQGLCCAAAPVFDASDSVVGALSVSGPSCRLSLDVLRSQVAPRVFAAAEQLSRGLGHVATRL
jgi:IclR family KDG regulon transcriptional repressor